MERISLKQEKVPELSFAHLAPEIWAALGKIPRTGWVNRGVRNPETVQDHTIALRTLANSLENLSEAETKDLLEMLEIHDWPEAIHGDQVILTDNIEEKRTLKANKFEQESQALAAICKELGESGDRIMSLWLRFEHSDDEAAALGRQLDKYQAIEKALEYEKLQGIPLFKEFLDYSIKENNINHPILLERLKSLEIEWKALNNPSNTSL